jgi:hypothetical protein
VTRLTLLAAWTEDLDVDHRVWEVPDPRTGGGIAERRNRQCYGASEPSVRGAVPLPVSDLVVDDQHDHSIAATAACSAVSTLSIPTPATANATSSSHSAGPDAANSS